MALCHKSLAIKLPPGRKRRDVERRCIKTEWVEIPLLPFIANIVSRNLFSVKRESDIDKSVLL